MLLAGRLSVRRSCEALLSLGADNGYCFASFNLGFVAVLLFLIPEIGDKLVKVGQACVLGSFASCASSLLMQAKVALVSLLTLRSSSDLLVVVKWSIFHGRCVVAWW